VAYHSGWAGFCFSFGFICLSIIYLTLIVCIVLILMHGQQKCALNRKCKSSLVNKHASISILKNKPMKLNVVFDKSDLNELTGWQCFFLKAELAIHL